MAVKRGWAEKNRALSEYGEVLSDLDPRFYQPYTFIGLSIPFQTGRDEYVNAGRAPVSLRERETGEEVHVELRTTSGRPVQPNQMVPVRSGKARKVAM